MKPREVVAGRSYQGDIVIAVPSVERGIFMHEVGLDHTRVYGEIALVTGVSKENTDRIKAGDPDVLNDYVVLDEDEPGLLHMTKARVALLVGSQAVQELSHNAVLDKASVTIGWIKEYSPYPPHHSQSMPPLLMPSDT